MGTGQFDKLSPVLTHLACWSCGKTHAYMHLTNLCDCGKPLRAEYGLSPETLDPAALKDRAPDMWRYRELLPSCEPVTLGEGMTPLHWTPGFGDRWYIKDEAVNPTASFKARGMSAAVSMAKGLGAAKLAVPSAGNAGGALAAYAAKAGLEAHIFMPSDTPQACITECRCHGADLRLTDGLITECAEEMRRFIAASDAPIFDLSTMKEPYRAEGKKTMGFELAEQMGWRLPDAIVFPTGGGTGIIGMWKAFEEMEKLSWIGRERPKMICVQAAGCAPIVKAFEAGRAVAAEVEDAKTVAAGLRVPRAIGDFIVLSIVRASNGTALSVTDEEMVGAATEIAARTGIFACPEGGATLAAARRLGETGYLRKNDTVVLFNTGSGLKYVEAFD